MIRISNISFYRFGWKNQKLDWPKCARTEELPEHDGDATLKALDDIRNKLESLLPLKPAVDDLKSVITKLTEENKQLMESLNSATKGNSKN